MSFIDRLINLISVSGVTNSKLVDDLSLGKNSIGTWKANGNLPTGETIVKLAKYFGVTSDYLLCLSDIPQITTPQGDVINLNLQKGSFSMTTRTPNPEIVKAGLDEFFKVITEDGEITLDYLDCYKRIGIPSYRLHDIYDGNYQVLPSYDEFAQMCAPLPDDIDEDGMFSQDTEFSIVYPKCYALQKELVRCRMFDRPKQDDQKDTLPLEQDA